MLVLFLELLGVLLLGVGVFWLSPAAGMIVGGAFVVLFAQALEKNKAK